MTKCKVWYTEGELEELQNVVLEYLEEKLPAAVIGYNHEGLVAYPWIGKVKLESGARRAITVHFERWAGHKGGLLTTSYYVPLVAEVYPSKEMRVAQKLLGNGELPHSLAAEIGDRILASLRVSFVKGGWIDTHLTMPDAWEGV